MFKINKKIVLIGEYYFPTIKKGIGPWRFIHTDLTCGVYGSVVGFGVLGLRYERSAYGFERPEDAFRAMHDLPDHQLLKQRSFCVPDTGTFLTTYMLNDHMLSKELLAEEARNQIPTIKFLDLVKGVDALPSVPEDAYIYLDALGIASPVDYSRYFIRPSILGDEETFDSFMKKFPVNDAFVRIHSNALFALNFSDGMSVTIGTDSEGRAGLFLVGKSPWV